MGGVRVPNFWVLFTCLSSVLEYHYCRSNSTQYNVSKISTSPTIFQNSVYTWLRNNYAYSLVKAIPHFGGQSVFMVNFQWRVFVESGGYGSRDGGCGRGRREKLYLLSTHTLMLGTRLTSFWNFGGSGVITHRTQIGKLPKLCPLRV